MTHAEKIIHAVASLVKQEGKNIFSRKEIRQHIGVNQDKWMSGYTAIFQAMRSDHPGGAPQINARFKGVFRQVEHGRYSLTDRGEKLLGEFARWTKHYTDLLKAHKLFIEIEGRWKFYDAYMRSRDSLAWMSSGDVPLEEGLLLFGFIHSWDPNFQGDLTNFLEIYKDIFHILKRFERESIVKINLSNEVKKSISVIFDRIAMCPRERRFESTDTSKILHAIIPALFVMWDNKIRKAIIVEHKRDGRCYAYEFLPKMQAAAKEYLNSYISENGGDYESASHQISKIADNYSLAKLIDEYNYVRYTNEKTLLEVRNTRL